jgi:CDP-diglyceride synthetase
MAQDAIFYDLMNFSFRRNWKQAIAWYVVFFVIGVVLGAIAGGIIGVILGASGNQASILPTATAAGQIVVIPYVVLIGAALVYYRAKDIINIVLVLAGILLAIFFGALGGLIPMAYLVTRPTQAK